MRSMFGWRGKVWVVAAGVAVGASGVAQGGAIDELKSFVSETQSARAQFSQTVVARNGKVTQQSKGVFRFLRPGKFRFVYEQPYAQVLVGDGVKLWTYDPDLKQVTVKPIGDALGSSPAALLAGNGQFERNFTLKDLGVSERLDWVEAVPKQPDAGFERVRIGFEGGLPLAMDVFDNFGQITHLRFTGFERNPKLDAGDFHFTPPKGADVVGE